MSTYISNKELELSSLYKFKKILREAIESFPMPTNGMEELELDEICLDFNDCNIKIEQIEHFLLTIKNTLKIKKELIDTGNMILYNH